ncbi:NusA-like transcription termination signal-binding factor [Candidatus Woesearchaeota archaeon]|nr:NusA-like transcription termination signal-binding factor [Candidatus Woesearchaeota archaeon]
MAVVADSGEKETGSNLQRIRYDSTLMKLMSFFESVTRAKLKDCFVDNNGMLVFVVEATQFGIAVGRAGSNVKRLEAVLKKKIRIVEFSDDLNSFVENLIRPSKARSIGLAGGIVTIDPEPGSRGYIIGRAGKNLRNYEAILKRYFPIKEARVA